MASKLEIRGGLVRAYPDVYTPEALAALEALAPFEARPPRGDGDADRAARSRGRASGGRSSSSTPDAGHPAHRPHRCATPAPATSTGARSRPTSQRQWIQGTGPATKPHASTASGLRNVAYALLSGADGWMFDGEDALGQVETMSLDNQRNLKLAIAGATRVPRGRRAGGGRDERLGARLLRPADHRRLARAARLHDADLPRPRPPPRRPPRASQPTAPASRRRSSTWCSTSSTTTSRLRAAGRSIVLYLPKIQTAEEAALWNDMLAALERHLGLRGRHDQGLRAGRADRGERSS